MSYGFKGVLKCLNANTYDIVKEIQLGSQEISQIVFSNESKTVVISSMDSNVRKVFWDDLFEPDMHELIQLKFPALTLSLDQHNNEVKEVVV